MGTIVRPTGLHEFYEYLYPPGSGGRVISLLPAPEDPPPDGEDFAGDENDDTYIQWAYTRNILSGGGSDNFMDLVTSVVEVPELAANITGVTAFVRVSHTSTASAPNQAGNGLEIGISHEESLGSNLWDLYSTSSTIDPFPLIADGVIYEHSFTWDLTALQENDEAFTWEELRTAVEAGQMLMRFWFHRVTVANQTARVDTIRIHEAWFEINSLAINPEIADGAATTRARFVF